MVFLGLTAVIAGLCFTPVDSGVGSNWTYHGNLGPAHWHVDYPACGGTLQSPINIDTFRVEFDENLPHFDLTDLSKTEGIQMELMNVHGHTVEVALSGAKQYVSGGGLKGQYQVEQFHFHWGGTDERGSEHSINKRFHPGEMHVVLCSTKYSDLHTALGKPHGIAVLGFFFKVGKHNIKFDHILSYFSYVSHSDQTKDIETFSIRDLLPPLCLTFYRYSGSLTTPPCSESVVWTLFKEEIEISKSQLQKFRNLKRNHHGEKDHQLVDDFRPVQKLNGRRITTNVQTRLVYKNSARVHFSAIPILLTLLLTCVLQRLLH